MTEAIPIEGKKPPNSTDAYDEVSLKIERLKSITVLIRAADPVQMIEKNFESLGYALEHMVDDIGEGVDELYKLGGVK
jgi:hypothetical protein